MEKAVRVRFRFHCYQNPTNSLFVSYEVKINKIHCYEHCSTLNADVTLLRIKECQYRMFSASDALSLGDNNKSTTDKNDLKYLAL